MIFVRSNTVQAKYHKQWLQIRHLWQTLDEIFAPVPGIDKSDQIDNSHNITSFTSCTDQIRAKWHWTVNNGKKHLLAKTVFVHSNFTDYLRIAQAIITNSFRAKYSGWNFCPTPGIDKSDQIRQNTYLAISWQIMVFVHSNFTDYLRIAQAIITNSFRAKCSGWHFHPTPAVNKIDQIRQNTYLTISWERMIFVHSNFTVHLKISQAVITNSFVAKYSGWNFCPTPGIDKSDQNRQNTYLAVSWQILVFVHSNFTDSSQNSTSNHYK